MEIKTLEERIGNPELLDLAIEDIKNSIYGVLRVKIEEADESVNAIINLYKGLSDLGITGEEFKTQLQYEGFYDIFVAPIEEIYYKSKEVLQ